MNERVQALRDVVEELEQRPADVPKDVLPQLAALAHRIEKLAAHEFVQRLDQEHRESGDA
jgi:hypothetical protein